MYFNWFLLNLIQADSLLLIDIFKYKNVFHALNFHCYSAESVIFMQKLFYDSQFRVVSLQVDKNTSFSTLNSYTTIGIVVNTSCVGWTLSFEKLDIKYHFKSTYKWFIITKNLSSTLESLSQFPIEIDSDMTLIHKIDDKLFNLYEVYNTGYFTHGEFVVNKIGSWNNTLRITAPKRMELTGVILKGAVVVTQKVVNETFEEYVERSRSYKSDTLHKLKYFTLLKYLRDMYNFSYALQRTSSWGYVRNGSFDGMIGTLQRREADIGCSPVFFRLERAKVLDATVEVWRSRPVFILRHPKHPSGYSTIFTRPLTFEVWLCILALLITSAFSLWVMCRLPALRSEGDDDDNSASLAMLTIWSAICQQGTSVARGSTSKKLVIFVTFVFALIIYQYYNATVVSTLLREPPKNIRTPKDLLRSNLRAGVHDVLYNKDFFKHTSDPIALEMYKKKIATSTEYNFFTLEHGMALVKKGGFAFLVDSALAYGIMRNTFKERELCDAHEVALYPPQNMVAVVKKHSPYREHFAYGLRKMFESGLMHRIRSIWDEPRPACVRTPDSSLITVSIREFSTALLTLAAGMMAAIVVLCCEILSVRIRSSV